jgi:hypothetical protein
MPQNDPKNQTQKPLTRSKLKEQLRKESRRSPDPINAFQLIHGLDSKLKENLEPNSARTSIIVAVGLLEHGLATAILSKLMVRQNLKATLFDGDRERDGIIGSLYARTVMAHALDIYGENTNEDLGAIRALRNHCAHAPSEIDLTKDDIAPLCEFHVLKYYDQHVQSYYQKLPPIRRVLGFLSLLVPYLFLHESKEWLGSKNQLDLRATFS